MYILVNTFLNFYPRSPCGERQLYINRPTKTIVFLSTLSLRRATRVVSVQVGRNVYFYPRSPCGERPARRALGFVDPDISIHALLAESDNRFIASSQPPAAFLSTLSLRRATALSQSSAKSTPEISIHALLAESDRAPPYNLMIHQNFYPRSPCGERPSSTVIVILRKNFYPRSPCGERRVIEKSITFYPPISIHALLAESDCITTTTICIASIFLSTLSLRRATLTSVVSSAGTIDFYPRSPCGERHLRVVDGSKSSIISIHALLAESD